MRKDNEKITDADIREKIVKSAQDVEIPEELEPERVAGRLRGRKIRGGLRDAAETAEKAARGRRVGGEGCARRMMRQRGLRAAAVAACFCLCAGVAALHYDSAWQSGSKAAEDDMGQQGGKSSTAADDAVACDETADGTAEDDAGDASLTDPKEEKPVKKLKHMYTLAGDYGEVYDLLAMAYDPDNPASAGELESDCYSYSADREAFDLNLAANAGETKMENNRSGAEDTAEQPEYSTTNLQVADVDESDIVKTDGKYLYVVQESSVKIIDIRSGKPKVAAEVFPGLDLDTDRICEMYVADRKLILLAQTESSTLKQQEKAEAEESSTTYMEGDGKEVPSVNGRTGNIVPLEDDASADTAGGTGEWDYDTAYIQVTQQVEALVYDISEPEKPAFLYKTVQDGIYRDSRKIGDRLYLFTGKSLWLQSGMARYKALEDGNLSGWLPCVGGSVVDENRIYLGERGNESWLMASIDLADNGQLVDSMMIVGEDARIYVTQNSVYFYYSDYMGDYSFGGTGVVKTRIARFALAEDGKILAKAAGAVRGQITDTFALNEKDGYLRVLTTAFYGEENKNRIYVLDENMKVTGKLTDIAPGEQIYAARFFDDTGYFVTYRNTDPLFSVDFRNPTDPKIVGALEVTGFSEYLHFWSDGLLLGIGSETDADTGECKGIKLSMFDISDPADVKETTRFVIEGTDYSEALYQYKAVLADPVKNVIAFTVEYSGAERQDYVVFSYRDGAFVNCLQEKDIREHGSQRSLYSGDVLYYVDEKRVWAYNMKTWKKSAKLNLKKN